jgi:hypothetical protein
MTKDKIQAARDNGYSDDEIAQYLSSSDGKFKQAIESGYSVDEIANHLGRKKEIKSGPDSEPQVEVQPSEEGPSAGRIAGGLAAEIAAAEGLKYAGSFAGPWGYAAGATAGGITGSILAQEIENPNKPISWGRVVADTALNFIPGQKLLKGGKATTKVGKALVGTGQVAARGAVGSVMATGAQAVEKGIEEQRMLTPEEAKVAAGTGFALGGGLEIAGKAFKAFSPQAQKLFQKSPKEVDDLVKAGDADTIKAIDEIVNVSGIEPEELASKNDEEFVKKVIDREQAAKPEAVLPTAKPTQEIDVDVIPQQKEITTKVKEPFEYDIPEKPTIGGSISKLAQGFKSRFAPSLVTGGKTIAAEAKKAGAVSEAGRTTGAILEAKINRIVSKSKNPEEANRLAYEFLNGKIDELPVDLKKIEPDLIQGRKWIGQYQDELLQNHYNGQRPLEEPLLREIERSRNDGDYLTKPYLFFESASYKPSKQQEAALKGALVRNGMTRGDADVYINQLNAKRADGPDDVSNFVFQSPAGILKKRKDFIPELRSYLGEVTETGSILSATMSKLSRINAYDTSDFNIKTTLRGLGIAKTKNDGIAPTDQPLNLRRTPKLRPDQPLPEDQLYVPIEVQRAINSLYGADLDNNGIDYTTRFLADMIGTGGSLSSAAKTVFSPFSYSVQPLANFVLSVTAGGNPFKGLGRGIKYGMMQYKPIASRMGIESVSEFKRRKELNIIGQGLIQGNLEAGLKGPKLGAAAQKVVKPFGVAYSLADTAFRIPVYESNLSFLNKVIPGSSSKEFLRDIEEMAASITNLTYPNYDYASTALKTMSKWQAFLSAYATFPLEMFRTAWNQGVMATKMIDGSLADFLESKYGSANRAYGSVNREAIRKEGMARFARLAAALSAPIAGINLYNRHVGGVSEEEQKAVRESVSPEYNEYNPNAIHKTKDGKYYETNISYTAPFSDISSIFMAGARGENFEDSLKNTVAAFGSKIIGDESFLIAPLMAAIGNYIPRTDKKISDEVEAIPNLLERTGWFASKAFTSGLQREIENATRAYNPTTSRELALKAAGLRTKLIDPVEGVGFRLRDIRSSLNSISSKYASATYNMAGQDLEDEYNNQNRVYQDNFNLISKHIKNMRTIGFPKEKIIQVMVDNGIGHRNTILAINGYTPSIPKIKEVTPSSEWDRISQLPEGNQINEIRKIEDIRMRKKVFSFRKNDLVNKRRGITEEDQLWRSLEEKEQIDIAIDMMKNHNDPDAVLRGLIRKGQVSPRTSIDIKKRFQAEKVLAR